MTLSRKELAALLPDAPTKTTINPSNLVITLIGPPKWGKTSFFMSNPNAVLLAFEEGHKFQRGFKMSIDCWDVPKRSEYEPWKDDEGVNHMSLMQAIAALEAFNKRFNLVIIDTFRMMEKMCSDYHAEQGGVEVVGDLGEWGKGWDVGLNIPIRKALMAILKTGRGVALLCHTQIEIARFTSGDKARKEMRLAKGTKELAETQSDIIMHGELGKRRPGMKMRDRILVCDGNQDTMAGSRTGSILPERFIVDPTNQWAQFEKFFTDPKAADAAEARYRKFYQSKTE